MMSDLVFQVVLPSYLAVALAAVLFQRRVILRRTQREPVRAGMLRGTDSPAAFAASVLMIATFVLITDILIRAKWPSASEEMLTWPLLGGLVAMRWGGLALSSFGVCLYLIGLFGIGQSWRIGIDTERPGPLVTTGLFKYLRHPLYAGILAASGGLAVLTADVLSIPAAAAAWTTLPIQARLEEDFLAARYPDYEGYRARTGRFVPKWWVLSAAMAEGWRFLRAGSAGVL
jgi:protein-S-isoprenylcysteine O-methyltransferase Ste14